MNFVTFREYFDDDQVQSLVEILEKNGITYQITQDRESLDSLYGTKQFSKRFYVKIKKEDFAKTNALLLELSAELINAVDKDHYLFSFTDEELLDIISKPDEWNELDYQLAQRILNERGKKIDQETIDQLKEARIIELAKPEERYRAWIYVGYLSAFLGGPLGIFIGWYLITSHKTLPNGVTVYGFDAKDRQHGKRIVIIGIIVVVTIILFRIELIRNS